MIPSPVESRFDTYHEYRAAVSHLLALARQRILIFDPDLKETGMETVAAVETLGHFAAAQPAPQLSIVLHRTEHAQRNCPRFMGLLKAYGHVIAVRQSPEELRRLTDCFMVADGLHAVVRFHADHPRGKLLLQQEQEIGPWQRRFDELWELSTPALALTTLGL